MLLCKHPIVDFLVCCSLVHAVELYERACELLAFAGNFVEVIVRKLIPLLFDAAFQLLPVSLDDFPIRRRLDRLTAGQRLERHRADSPIGEMPVPPPSWSNHAPQREAPRHPLGALTQAGFKIK